MASEGESSLALRIAIRALLNVALVWFMANYLDQYFQVSGGWPAYIIIGALLTLMNIFVRPVLAIITMPLKLFATILAIIIVNGAFVQLTHMIALQMDPDLVTLEIFGGLWGWIVVASMFGLGNWIMKEMLKH